MGLSHGYGVLVGTIANYYRDDPDAAGRYYHGNLIVAAQGHEYRCAIDVDSHQSNTGVEWRTVPLRPDELGGLLGLTAGYHALASNASSGAIDYVRSPMLRWRLGCLALLAAILRRKFHVSEVWKRGTSVAALADLEPLIATTRSGGRKVLVFGEPFTTGFGMHNIHQNQGDPLGSPWAGENAIWQDGCTILQQADDAWVAFLNKFTSQSYATDDLGHPA
jgi:hypothetical protein